MLSLTNFYSCSSFILIKRLFISYSLSAIRVVSSAYLRLLLFLLGILIPACDASSPAFHMMYSAYRFLKNKVLCTVLVFTFPSQQVVIVGLLSLKDILSHFAFPTIPGKDGTSVFFLTIPTAPSPFPHSIIPLK